MKTDSRGYHSPVVKVLITVALLLLVFYQVDLYRTMVQWQEAEWRYIIFLGIPVALACLFINVLRWYLILAHQGFRPRLTNLMVIYTKAAFVASFFPGGMTAGDIYRISLLTKRTQNIDASIKSVFLDRASGFFGLLIVALAACLYYLSVGEKRDAIRPFLMPGLLIVMACAAFCAGVVWIQRHYLRISQCRYPLWNRLRSYTEMMPRYFEDKRLIVREVSLSLALQLVIVGWLYIVAQGLHIAVPFVVLCMAGPLVTLFSLLPVSLGGIGVREAGYVVFLIPFGLTAGEATSLSLVSGMVQNGIRLLFGALFLFDSSKDSIMTASDPQSSEAEAADRI
jgi:uncharacterized protein (TIRG00374 family)